MTPDAELESKLDDMSGQQLTMELQARAKAISGNNSKKIQHLHDHLKSND